MSPLGKRRPIVLYQPRDQGAWMPLGLLAVGSYLREEHVVLVDGRFDLAPEARVAELAPEASCLGVGVRTGPPLRDALRVSAAARAANPRLTVVWGGPHPSLAPASCLGTGVVDACARGAGEQAFADAIHAGASGRSLTGIAGLATPGACEASAQAPPAPEGTPRARYSLLNLERHFEARKRRRLDFCSSRGRREAGFSGLPAERVVAELAELDERHRLSEIAFRDEDFFADVSRAEAILALLAEDRVRFRWRVAARPEDVLGGGAPRLELQKRGGCVRVDVQLRPDVAADRAARERVLESASLIHGAGLAACFDLSIGDPGPKLSTLAATVSLARALSAIDPVFETPLRRLPRLPVGDQEGDGLESWVARSEAAWPDERAERRLRRARFYLSEGQRPPGRRPRQHLLRMLCLLRMRVGFFGLDFERSLADLSSVLRTGRLREPPPVD